MDSKLEGWNSRWSGQSIKEAGDDNNQELKAVTRRCRNNHGDVSNDAVEIERSTDKRDREIQIEI